MGYSCLYYAYPEDFDGYYHYIITAREYTENAQKNAHYKPFQGYADCLGRCLGYWFITVRRVSRTLLPIAFYSMKTTLVERY